MSGEAPGSAEGPGYVDLHAHSTASDGTLPPERVVEAAGRRGLVAIALTDHDTVDGLPAACEAGERIGVRVVPGVELSAFEEDHEVHLLALHVTRSDGLQARLSELREMRQRRAREIVAKLNSVGIAITIEDVLEQSAGGAVGRPHVARALIARGAVTDFKDAFAQYLGAGGSAFVPKDRLSIADAIGIAHDAGAIAVWAHPGESGRRERLEPLVAAGLDGVEVRHPSHSREDMLRLQALADFFGILPSGGSDWHGSNDGPRRLGVMNVPREWLDRQDARVASLAAASTR
ncbi:MAG TPA: PHP domain-containing protein [Gemmatimonadaceae bacterium]|nr:PHP domain-containing protein [Gemmatimonadaceae bacterium]